jgi:hypothetical protein
MKKLPIEERWSARFFELNEVFTDLDLQESNVLLVNNFFNITTWQEYQLYIRSEYSNQIVKPPKDLFSYKEFHGVSS